MASPILFLFLDQSRIESVAGFEADDQSSKKISSISGGDGYFQDLFPRHLPVDRKS